MKYPLIVAMALTASASLSPQVSLAETRSDTYNGATCIPYPPFSTTNGVPYSSFLYGFGQMAFCHFTVPDSWSPKNISYVLFEGSSPSNYENVRVRLCVYSGLAQTCGAERTIAGNWGVNWVAPPSPLPTFVTGAYLSVAFPNTGASTLMNYIPVWHRYETLSTNVFASSDFAVAQLAKGASESEEWIAQLRSSYQTEARNDGWALSKESQLREAAARVSSVSDDLIRTLECKQSRCKVQARLPVSLPQQALHEKLLSVQKWVEAADPDGQFTIVHTVGAEGHDVEVFTSSSNSR